uniref:Uncharacterized protein n=1 Tax=Globodera rostochiensis TaxID=31243 RepID=A0A914GZB8_GLORO
MVVISTIFLQRANAVLGFDAEPGEPSELSRPNSSFSVELASFVAPLGPRGIITSVQAREFVRLLLFHTSKMFSLYNSLSAEIALTELTTKSGEIILQPFVSELNSNKEKIGEFLSEFMVKMSQRCSKVFSTHDGTVKERNSARNLVNIGIIFSFAQKIGEQLHDYEYKRMDLLLEQQYNQEKQQGTTEHDMHQREQEQDHEVLQEHYYSSKKEIGKERRTDGGQHSQHVQQDHEVLQEHYYSSKKEIGKERRTDGGQHSQHVQQDHEVLQEHYSSKKEIGKETHPKASEKTDSAANKAEPKIEALKDDDSDFEELNEEIEFTAKERECLDIIEKIIVDEFDETEDQSPQNGPATSSIHPNERQTSHFFTYTDAYLHMRLHADQRSLANALFNWEEMRQKALQEVISSPRISFIVRGLLVKDLMEFFSTNFKIDDQI